MFLPLVHDGYCQFSLLSVYTVLKNSGGRFLFSWISQKYSMVVSIKYDHGALESRTSLYLIGGVFLD